MTGKERLTRLFNGKNIDRVPIWMLFPINPTPYAVDVKSLPSYQPLIDIIYKKTDFIDRRVFDTGFCINSHNDIRFETSSSRENGRSIYKESVMYKDVRLERSIMKTDKGLEQKPFVQSIEDLDKILALPYKMPEPDVGIFEEQQQALGESGIMAIVLPDSLSVLHELCDETGFIMMCYSETEKVLEFLDAIHKRALEYARYFLERNICDLYWIAGSEFAVPPLLPPEFFNKLVVKYQKELVDLIRNFGKKAMLHCHGRIKNVLDGFAQINPNSLHPIEAPPMGDCSMTQARKVLGNEVILAGNIQYGDLWDKTEDEIEDIVISTIEEGKKGPFILAMTASPTMPEINDNVVRNYFRIVETALKHGKY